MNVLELCLSPAMGGLELYVYRCSHALSNLQEGKNTITAVISPNSPLIERYRNTPIIKTHFISPTRNYLPLITAKKLAKIINSERIDAIHIHWGKDFPVAVFAKMFSKRKPRIIYTRHMMITRSKNDVYHNFLYRQIDLLICITKELEILCEKYIPILKNKSLTQYHGVPAPKHRLNSNEIIQQRNKLGFNKKDFVIGLFGRIEKEKGQHLLIKAIHQAKQKNKTFNAIIVGREMEPGYRNELKTLVKSLGVENNLLFQDFTHEPQQLMQLCDCIVLATHKETFGLVLPEAMRSGIAVIGSNSGGVLEIIKHEKTGLLFESQSVDSLYHQLKRLHDNPEFRISIASRGESYANQNFNEHSHFKELDRILHNTIDKNS